MSYQGLKDFLHEYVMHISINRDNDVTITAGSAFTLLYFLTETSQTFCLHAFRLQVSSTCTSKHCQSQFQSQSQSQSHLNLLQNKITADSWADLLEQCVRSVWPRAHISRIRVYMCFINFSTPVLPSRKFPFPTSKQSLPGEAMTVFGLKPWRCRNHGIVEPWRQWALEGESTRKIESLANSDTSQSSCMVKLVAPGCLVNSEGFRKLAVRSRRFARLCLVGDASIPAWNSAKLCRTAFQGSWTWFVPVLDSDRLLY